MEPIPLPSPIHYELILQLLEKQTMTSIGPNQDLRNQFNQLTFPWSIFTCNNGKVIKWLAFKTVKGFVFSFENNFHMNRRYVRLYLVTTNKQKISINYFPFHLREQKWWKGILRNPQLIQKWTIRTIFQKIYPDW